MAVRATTAQMVRREYAAALRFVNRAARNPSDAVNPALSFSRVERTHAHIRQEGAHNQQVALLFRDYLRAAPSMRLLYDIVKRRAAALFLTNIKGFMW